VEALAASERGNPNAPKLLIGTGAQQTHLLVAVTADRGLAGAFNSNVSRYVRLEIMRLLGEGKSVKLMTVGRKGNDTLRRDFAANITGTRNFVGKRTLVFNRFQSVMTQTVMQLPLIPAAAPKANDNRPDPMAAPYEIEPDDNTLLESLLPRNLAVQIYAALLENAAGFFASQMTAMDNATRNAGDMIKRLSLNYNRARQANITKELIEIISGAEAV
jgi:F-type H+-transporting ATPase subunit gamma